MCVVLLLGASAARAGDFETFDFSLRFPAAISRFASYADVAAMGNAQAASEWSSSINPASAAWPHAGRKYLNAFSPQATAVQFDAGTNLFVISEALTMDAGARGVFLPAAAQILSNHRQDRTGLGFGFSANYFQLQWGKLVAANTAVGVNLSATFSDTRLDLADTVVARSNGKSYSLRVGILQKLSPALRAGVVLECAVSPGRTDFSLFDPESLSFQRVRAEDTTDQVLVRTGIAWEYSKGSTLTVDYQGGVFNNDTGRLRVHRFPVGVEHLVVKDILFVRAGGTVDTRGDVALTAGFGLSVSERTSVDVAYQHGMFPEIEREFGDADTYTLSVGFAF